MIRHNVLAMANGLKDGYSQFIVSQENKTTELEKILSSPYDSLQSFCKALIICGANIKIKDRNEQCALDHLMAKPTQSLPLAIDLYGGDSDAIDEEGNNLAHFTAKKGRCSLLNELFNAGYVLTCFTANKHNQLPLELLSLHSWQKISPSLTALHQNLTKDMAEFFEKL